MPRFPDQSEERPEQAIEDAPAFVQQLFQLGRVELPVSILQFYESPVDADDDQDVAQADDDQERPGDREPDDLTGSLPGRELGDDRARRDDEGDDQDEDDGRVTEGKPHAHREGAFSLLEQFPRRVVDRRDVIRVYPMPEAEGVGDEAKPREDRGKLADDEREDEPEDRRPKDRGIDHRDLDSLGLGNAEPGRVRVARRGRRSSMTHVSEVTRMPD